MLVRIADSLYWMARYIERANSITRLIKINYTAALDYSQVEKINWSNILSLTVDLNPDEIQHNQLHYSRIVSHILTSKENVNSVYNVISYARNNARTAQDQITREIWRSINDLYLFISSSKVNRYIVKNEILELIDELTQHITSYYGNLKITMPRNESYSYINLGNYVERALQTIKLFNNKYSEIGFNLEAHNDILFWKHLLLSVSGYEFFLKNSSQELNTIDVANMILFNDAFPHSLIYSIKSIHHEFEKLHFHNNKQESENLYFNIGKMHSQLLYTRIQNLSPDDFKKLCQDLAQETNNIVLDYQHHYLNYI